MATLKKASSKVFVRIHPAVVTVWAALVAVSNLLPSIPLMGVGGTISVATIIQPLAGIFFGPYAGALAAGLGGFIGNLMAPATAVLGVFTCLIGAGYALLTGWYCEGKWIPSSAVALLAIVLWFSTKIGRQAPIFAIMFHGTGALAGLISGLFGKRVMLGKNPLLKAVFIFLMSYAGMVLSASVSNFFVVLLWQSPVITWKMLAFTAPVERIIFAVAAVIVGTPLLIGLPKIGIHVGPQNPDEIQADEAEPEPSAAESSKEA